MSAAKKKQLFGDDSGSDDDGGDAAAFAAEAEESFKVNRAFASHYDQVKRKQELQKLSSKYGDVDDDSDDTEEDDDAKHLTNEAESDFAALLKRLRSNDPSLRDRSVAFFRSQRRTGSDSDDDDDERPAKPARGGKFTLKDEFQRGVVAGAEDDDAPVAVAEDDEKRRGRKAVTKEEKAARAAFLAAAEGADTSAAEFAIKDGTKGIAEKEKRARAAARGDDENAADIEAALGASGVDEDKFLAKFFSTAGWKLEKEPEYTWDQEAADEQDEQFYDDAEQWEKEFQDKRFRHEEGAEAIQLQAFPRQQEGLLRAKDTARKDARERRAERQQTEESRAVEDLKRLKNLKKEEIKAFQRKIAEVAGLNRRESSGKKGKKGKKDLEKPNFDDEDDAAEEARIAKLLTQAALEEDYDPETFDAQMAAIFDDGYYNNVDDDEMGIMAAEDDFAVGADEGEESNYYLANEDEVGADGEMKKKLKAKKQPKAKDAAEGDDEAAASDSSSEDEEDAAAKRAAVNTKTKQQRKAINAELPEELRGFDDELLYPTRQLEAAIHRADGADADGDADPAELKRQLDRKIEEYWELHHSGTAGGMKTRFRYREVNPERFGLDEEEIFTMDDRALNMIAPLASYATYASRTQNTKDRYRSLHRRKVLRMLPADRQSRRYKAGTVVFDPDTIDPETGNKIARTVRRQVEGADGELDTEIAAADAEEATKRAAVGAAKQSKSQGRRQQRGGGGAPAAEGEGAAEGASAPRPPRPHHQHGGGGAGAPRQWGGRPQHGQQQHPRHQGNQNAQGRQGGDAKRPRSADPAARGGAQRPPRTEQPRAE